MIIILTLSLFKQLMIPFHHPSYPGLYLYISNCITFSLSIPYMFLDFVGKCQLLITNKINRAIYNQERVY